MLNQYITPSNWETLTDRIKQSPLKPAKFAEPEYRRIFAYLESVPEFHTLAWSLKKNPGVGRTGYQGTTHLKILLVMRMENINSYAAMHRFLKKRPDIARILGLSSEIPVPTTMQRNFKKVGESGLERLKQAVLKRFYAEHPEIEDDIIVDGTNFNSYSNYQSKTDPEAGWQKKSTAPDAFGYQAVVLVASKTGLILGSNVQGKGAAEDKNLKKMFSKHNYYLPPKAAFFLGDARYDSKEISDYVYNSIRLIPIIDYNHRRSRHRCYYQLPSNNWRYQYCPREFWFRSLLLKRLRPRVETPFNRLKPQGKYIRSNVRGLSQNEKWFSFFVLGYNLAKIVAQEPCRLSWTLIDWVNHVIYEQYWQDKLSCMV